MLYRIALFCLFCSSLFGAENVYLKTPNLSQSNIIGVTYGIRPYRMSGVRIEAQEIQDKLIVHNYGYGGSGLTLSFGGSNQVLNILKRQGTTSNVVAVLGAGVVGLATAYDLLQQGYEVHIYADNWSPDVTSNVAAGIWTHLEFPGNLSDETKEFHKTLLTISEQRFTQSTSSNPEFAGVTFMAYYSFQPGPNRINSADEVDVIAYFDNGAIKNGRRRTRLAIDGKIFMDDLFTKVQNNGAFLQQKHFASLDDVLALSEPVIINCMSFGSRDVFGEADFLPVRGQMIYFTPQDGIDYLFYQDIPGEDNMWTLIYPWSDRLILGGTYEYGVDDPTTTPQVLDLLIYYAQKCVAGEF